ncbi:hypothetical protein VKT23_014392 [Stygiomarasmius scandens]|uniref:Uncharacterized protein n=1 Tax=Marasmiellus scandens TaxID=2682957 RepID=A0ABR1J329_9AGAR
MKTPQSPLSMSNFPHVKFWTRGLYLKHQKSVAGNSDALSTTKQRRGRPSNNNTEHPHNYLEDENGAVVPKDVTARMSQVTRSIWKSFDRKGLAPLVWSDLLPLLAIHYRARMEEDFPFLRYCLDGYKLDIWTTKAYPSFVSNHLKTKPDPEPDSDRPTKNQKTHRSQTVEIDQDFDENVLDDPSLFKMDIEGDDVETETPTTPEVDMAPIASSSSSALRSITNTVSSSLTMTSTSLHTHSASKRNIMVHDPLDELDDLATTTTVPTTSSTTATAPTSSTMSTTTTTAPTSSTTSTTTATTPITSSTTATVPTTSSTTSTTAPTSSTTSTTAPTSLTTTTAPTTSSTTSATTATAPTTSSATSAITATTPTTSSAMSAITATTPTMSFATAPTTSSTTTTSSAMFTTTITAPTSSTTSTTVPTASSTTAMSSAMSMTTATTPTTPTTSSTTAASLAMSTTTTTAPTMSSTTVTSSDLTNSNSISTASTVIAATATSSAPATFTKAKGKNQKAERPVEEEVLAQPTKAYTGPNYAMIAWLQDNPGGKKAGFTKWYEALPQAKIKEYKKQAKDATLAAGAASQAQTQ